MYFIPTTKRAQHFLAFEHKMSANMKKLREGKWSDSIFFKKKLRLTLRYF